MAIVRDPFPPQRKLRIKLYTFIILDLENNQIDAINYIEAKSTEFATTTRPAKDNCWASQYSSLCFIDNSSGDNITSYFKSMPTSIPNIEQVHPGEAIGKQDLNTKRDEVLHPP